MSYEILLTDMFYRKINIDDVVSEDVFIEKIEDMMHKKLHSGKSVKWVASARVNLIKRGYGLCGYKMETVDEIGHDLSLCRNYIMMLLNRSLKIIENIVVDESNRLSITYEDAILSLFGSDKT